MHPDAKRWNARYEEKGQERLERPPVQLLRDYAHLLPPEGLALDAASGVATNGAFLAQHGLRVIALDISETALQLALQRAREQGLHLSAAVVDLASPWLPPGHFDVVVNFRFLERATFDVYRQALKIEGLLFFETFVQTDQDIDRPAYYLNPGELLGAFQDFQIVHWKEFKMPGADRSTAQLVARKTHPTMQNPR